MDDYENGASERMTVDVNEVATISPEDMKVHGLLVKNDDEGTPMILVPMETLDN